MRDAMPGAAEAAVAAPEIPQRRAEVVGIELGPHAGGEEQLRIGAFPEQEIAQPLFSAGADEKIDGMGGSERFLEALPGGGAPAQLSDARRMASREE